MAFLDYNGLSHFLDKIKTIFPLSAEKGVANGIAELDANGKVPSSQLPGYVDDVLEFDAINFNNWTEWVAGESYVIGDRRKITSPDDPPVVTGYVCIKANSSSTIDNTEWREATKFPVEGEEGKIYIAKDTNITYRWGGTVYVPIGSDLALGETSSTAYRGDRGKIAYDHATDVNRLTTQQNSGLYKISVTEEGHVGSAAQVQKSDLTSLGVLDADQGSANAGKALVVGNDGVVIPEDLQNKISMSYNTTSSRLTVVIP